MKRRKTTGCIEGKLQGAEKENYRVQRRKTTGYKDGKLQGEEKENYRVRRRITTGCREGKLHRRKSTGCFYLVNFDSSVATVKTRKTNRFPLESLW